MVQFQTDTDSLTSGNGHLILSQDGGLDSPPHDKTYFENHLLFLKNYYSEVSVGKLSINFKVLDSVVSLPHQLKYYSPPRSGSGNNLGLLFRDSWHAADSLYGNFNFSQYQCFVIFHAGSGRDIDFTSQLGYDPLPYDIPSIYLSLKSLQDSTMFGPGYAGQTVYGNFHITNSIIMPEWENFPVVDLRLGTNGLLAASFGSFLGLPDLFDTQNGVTGIGRFGLMDGQAIFAYGGIFPPEPSAWEKTYLGWVTPTEVSPSGMTQYNLYANATGKYSVLRIPINGEEYFLLENREGDAHHDGEKVTSVYNGVESTIVMTFANDTAYFDGSQIKNINGVVTDADEYDWALPQDTTYFGGILIWHIDQSVIDQNIATNTINANPDHRGVALMEAHGANEIGRFIQTIFGSYYYDGSFTDFWYAGNPDRTPSHRVGGNEFTPSTLPNSDGYNGANSHIYVTSFSSRDSLMSFDITADSIAPSFIVTSGFPKNIRSAAPASSPTFGHLSGDGSLQVIANNGDSLFAFDMDGTSAGFDSSGIFSNVGGRFQPVISASGANDTVYAMDDSVFYGFVDRDNNHDGTADLLFSTSSIRNAASLQPLYRLGSHVVALRELSNGNSDVELYSLSGKSLYSVTVSGNTSTGSELSQFAALDTNQFSFLAGRSLFLGSLEGDSVLVTPMFVQPVFQVPPYHSINVPSLSSICYAALRSGQSPYLAGLNSQSVYLGAAGNVPEGIFTLFPGDTIISGPVVADLDSDGNRDIIFASQTKIYAVSYTGAVLNHFPISTVGSEILSSDANEIYGSIAVADLDGDGKPEVIFGTKGGTLYAYTGATGQIFPGFPLSIGGGLAGSPALAYDASDSSLYLAAIGLDGYLYSWTFKASSRNQILWGNLLGDNSHSNSVIEPPQPVKPASIPTSLMPQDSVYNWPNPVTGGMTKIRFYLRDAAQVSITVYSFAGHKVADMQTAGVAGAFQEVDWNVAGVQSGVYFARVEAVSAKEREVKIIKIAVVK